MPQNAQKQVMAVDKLTAIQPTSWRLSRCFIMLFLCGLTDGGWADLNTYIGEDNFAGVEWGEIKDITLSRLLRSDLCPLNERLKLYK